MSDSNLSYGRLSLVALFVTALVAAQVTAAKVVAFELPITLPIAGSTLTVPAAVFAYALTFFASDCYAELYGKSATRRLVNVAFAMNFVLLALLWAAIIAPTFAFSPVDQSAFGETLGASTGVVVGSLCAYLVSQHWDVTVFHGMKRWTGGSHLWLRNITSTASSQLIDTVVFITIAFVAFQGLSISDAATLIVGQYLVKLSLVALDTPLVYVIVYTMRGTSDSLQEVTANA